MTLKTQEDKMNITPSIWRHLLNNYTDFTWPLFSVLETVIPGYSNLVHLNHCLWACCVVTGVHLLHGTWVHASAEKLIVPRIRTGKCVLYYSLALQTIGFRSFTITIIMWVKGRVVESLCVSVHCGLVVGSWSFDFKAALTVLYVWTYRERVNELDV